MKLHIPHLKIGDEVTVEVVEALGLDVCIVSFNGDLVRVKNESKKILEPQMRLRARVLSLDPLQFHIISHRSGSLDVVR